MQKLSFFGTFHHDQLRFCLKQSLIDHHHNFHQPATTCAYAADHAVILMYRFGENNYPSTNIRLEQFDAHLEVLASSEYNVMALADIIDRIQGGQSLPDRTVAITIDDAYLSVYTEALPRLRI